MSDLPIYFKSLYFSCVHMFNIRLELTLSLYMSNACVFIQLCYTFRVVRCKIDQHSLDVMMHNQESD